MIYKNFQVLQCELFRDSVKLKVILTDNFKKSILSCSKFLSYIYNELLPKYRDALCENDWPDPDPLSMIVKIVHTFRNMNE